MLWILSLPLYGEDTADIRQGWLAKDQDTFARDCPLFYYCVIDYIRHHTAGSHFIASFHRVEGRHKVMFGICQIGRDPKDVHLGNIRSLPR
jgi:hypothetical protein